MIDFHTHILPNVDDGSRSVEETFNLLKEAGLELNLNESVLNTKEFNIANVSSSIQSNLNRATSG